MDDTLTSPSAKTQSQDEPLLHAVAAQKLTLTEVVIKEIVAQIKDGWLKPGDMLPSERQLTAMFDVSRSCVREALSSLVALGYIEVKSGSGSVVREIDRSLIGQAVIDLTGIAALVEKQSLAELFEVRQIVEVELVGMACLRATPEDMAHIEQAYRQYEVAARQQQPTAEFDAAFHQALAKAAHNGTMLKMLSSIKQLLRFGRERSEDVAHGGNIKSIEYHRRIYERIQQRDVVGARAAMREHILDVEQYTLAQIQA